MMSFICAILIALNVVTFTLLLSGAGHGFLSLGDLKSIDVASIALISATLVVTVVGVGVALLAVFGYGDLRKSVIRAAEREARRVSKDIATVVATRIAREISPTETDPGDANAIAQAEGDGEEEHQEEDE